MAATTLCSYSGELEIVQLYHGHGRKELFNTLTILQSFSVLFFLKESLPLFIDFKEGRTQTGSESQNEFGFLRLLEFWKNEWIYLIQWIYLISFIPFFQHIHGSGKIEGPFSYGTFPDSGTCCMTWHLQWSWANIRTDCNISSTILFMFIPISTNPPSKPTSGIFYARRTFNSLLDVCV